MAICPECGSGDITAVQKATVSWGRAIGGWILFGPIGGAVGAITGESRHVNACLDCGTTWAAAELRRSLQIIEEYTGKRLNLETEPDRLYLKDFMAQIEPVILAGVEAEKKATEISAEAEKADSELAKAIGELKTISAEIEMLEVKNKSDRANSSQVSALAKARMERSNPIQQTGFIAFAVCSLAAIAALPYGATMAGALFILGVICVAVAAALDSLFGAFENKNDRFYKKRIEDTEKGLRRYLEAREAARLTECFTQKQIRQGEADQLNERSKRLWNEAARMRSKAAEQFRVKLEEFAREHQ